MSNNPNLFSKSKHSNSVFSLDNKINLLKLKRSQTTIFIIIAILIVVGIMVYFVVREDIGRQDLPKELSPVYSYFVSCVEDETKNAAYLMGSQAGYLELPEFESGSEYMPFSSQLDFVGRAVPYWYYVSGNGIVKEQVLTRDEMQGQLEDYLEKRISKCDLSEFEDRGFQIQSQEPEVKALIQDNEINLEVEMDLEISYGDTTSSISRHEINVDSKLGSFYEIAKKIYAKEQKDLFLENYGVDILRLYAPVSGVELTCSPKIWLQQDIKQELKQAIQGNTQALKIKGSYYSLSSPEKKYFVQEIGQEIGDEGESVNFIYSSDWPSKIKIYPDEEPLIAEPVGLQEGLGVLGFCYVPYHFVYDIAYPTLIQIYDAENIFQFPVAVVIDKNKPREGLDTGAYEKGTPELCKHRLTQIDVYTYDTNLNPVEADISFKCFGTGCDIGKTKITNQGMDAKLSSLFPQCVNGFIIAKAKGYEETKKQISTVNPDTADIILDKLYNLTINLTIDTRELEDEKAIIHFKGQEKSFSLAYPEQKSIEISEGQYTVEVMIYKNSSLSLSGFNMRKCIDIPKTGIGGIFGATEEKCYNIDVPAQTVSFALSAGGESENYFAESQLKESENLEIQVSSLPAPSSLEQLQKNYQLLKEKNLGFNFS